MRKRKQFYAVLLAAALAAGNFGASPMTANAASPEQVNLPAGNIAASDVKDDIFGNSFETVLAEAAELPEVLKDSEYDSEYNLWVGKTPVTAANKDNIPGLASGSASYDPDTKTLTFNNAVLNESFQGTWDYMFMNGCMIVASEDLTIRGKATLESSVAYCGILYLAAEPGEKLTIEADLTVRVPDTCVFGLCTSQSGNAILLINGGSLTFEPTAEDLNTSSFSAAIGLSGVNYVQRGGDVKIKKDRSGIVAQEIWFEGGSAVIDAGEEAVIAAKSNTTGGGVLQILNGLQIIEPEGAAVQSTTKNGVEATAIMDVSGNFAKLVKIGKPGDIKLIFDDVKENAWYAPAVKYVYEHGIMAGTGNSFKPSEVLTREQFVQVLYNHSAKPGAVGIANPFTDVKAGKWYTDAVLWADQNDIAHGYANSTKFGVGDNITREQFAQMLYKYAKLKEYNLDAAEKASEGYADSNKISSWAKTALDWAVSQGIMSGKGESGAAKSQLKLDPLGNTTRAECAQMVMKLLQKNGQ